MHFCIDRNIDLDRTGFPYQMLVPVNSSMTGITSGEGTANPSGAHEFNSDFQLCSCCSIISFLCNVL